MCLAPRPLHGRRLEERRLPCKGKHQPLTGVADAERVLVVTFVGAAVASEH